MSNNLIFNDITEDTAYNTDGLYMQNMIQFMEDILSQQDVTWHLVAAWLDWFVTEKITMSIDQWAFSNMCFAGLLSLASIWKTCCLLANFVFASIKMSWANRRPLIIIRDMISLFVSIVQIKWPQPQPELRSILNLMRRDILKDPAAIC